MEIKWQLLLKNLLYGSFADDVLFFMGKLELWKLFSCYVHTWEGHCLLVTILAF